MFKKIIFLFVIVIVVASISFLVFKKNSRPSQISSSIQISELRTDAKVIVGSITLNVELAENANEHARGLSGKTHLSDVEGMLFVFSNKTQPAFWMNDMLIPLDLIWIADGKIIYIHKNVPPPTKDQTDNDLPLYRPPQPIDYVLEVNSGFSDKFEIEEGDSFELLI